MNKYVKLPLLHQGCCEDAICQRLICIAVCCEPTPSAVPYGVFTASFHRHGRRLSTGVTVTLSGICRSQFPVRASGSMLIRRFHAFSALYAGTLITSLPTNRLVTLLAAACAMSFGCCSAGKHAAANKQSPSLVASIASIQRSVPAVVSVPCGAGAGEAVQFAESCPVGHAAVGVAAVERTLALLCRRRPCRTDRPVPRQAVLSPREMSHS